MPFWFGCVGPCMPNPPCALAPPQVRGRRAAGGGLGAGRGARSGLPLRHPRPRHRREHDAVGAAALLCYDSVCGSAGWLDGAAQRAGGVACGSWRKTFVRLLGRGTFPCPFRFPTSGMPGCCPHPLRSHCSPAPALTRLLQPLQPYNELDHQRPASMNETEYVSQMLTKVKRFAQVRPHGRARCCCGRGDAARAAGRCRRQRRNALQ